MWLDDWIRRNKKKFALMVPFTVIVLFFWYLLFPYPTPSIVEFINIDVDITLNETNPDVRVPADFGPHCRQVHLYGRQVVVDNNILTRATEVVMRLDYEMHHYEAKAFEWNLGCGVDHHLLERKTLDFDLVGAANGSFVMTVISIDGNDLMIEGETVTPGEVWEKTFEYSVMNGRYTVIERVVIENMGYQIAMSDRPMPCY